MACLNTTMMLTMQMRVLMRTVLRKVFKTPNQDTDRNTMQIQA